MYILIKLITIFFNMGVASGFLVGALLLLRPALVRALSPGRGCGCGSWRGAPDISLSGTMF